MEIFLGKNIGITRMERAADGGEREAAVRCGQNDKLELFCFYNHLLSS